VTLAFGCSDDTETDESSADADGDVVDTGIQESGPGQRVYGGFGRPKARINDADPEVPASDDAGTIDEDASETCAEAISEADLKPVYLAFAFDVSGSMGQGDKPWHDRTLKWEPVVESVIAFLENEDSTGLFASLTLFPEDPDQGWICKDELYEVPDVPMTALPSELFGETLAMIESGEWRPSTPTLHVMNGVITYVTELEAQEPGDYVIVLVTDGYPEGCNQSDDIQLVADAAATVVDTIPTYVIGVNNPPLEGAPDTIENLDQVAIAGGTGGAFLIDTGDPTQTIEDFTAVIDQIRGEALPCEATIPEPPDERIFEKEKVKVTHETSTGSRQLRYDPDCSSDESWHYDDPSNPSEIVLCESTCRAVRSDRQSKLHFEFTCEPVIEIII